MIVGTTVCFLAIEQIAFSVDMRRPTYLKFATIELFLIRIFCLPKSTPISSLNKYSGFFSP